MYSSNINRAKLRSESTAFDCVFHRIAEFNQYLFNFSTKCVRCDFDWIRWNILSSSPPSHLFVAMIATQKMKENGKGKSRGKNLSEIKYLRGKLLSVDDKFFQAIKSFFGRIRNRLASLSSRSPQKGCRKEFLFSKTIFSPTKWRAQPSGRGKW